MSGLDTQGNHSGGRSRGAQEDYEVLMTSVSEGESA